MYFATKVTAAGSWLQRHPWGFSQNDPGLSANPSESPGFLIYSPIGAQMFFTSVAWCRNSRPMPCSWLVQSRALP